MLDFLSWRGPKPVVDDRNFSEELRAVLGRSVDEARRLGTPFLGPEQLVLGMLSSPESEASRIFSAVGLPGTAFRAQLEAGAASGSTARSDMRRRATIPDLPWTNHFRRALTGAVEQARELEQSPVSSGHLLLAVLSIPSASVGRLLAERGVALRQVRDLMRRGVGPTATVNIQLDDDSDQLIYQQIVAQVQESIATGRLTAGQRLPPIRQLADELSVAPGTVARAYNELEAAGTVVTDRARGTFVAHPRQESSKERAIAIRELLRPAVVTAFHLGSSAEQLRVALAEAMSDIYAQAD